MAQRELTHFRFKPDIAYFVYRMASSGRVINATYDPIYREITVYFERETNDYHEPLLTHFRVYVTGDEIERGYQYLCSIPIDPNADPFERFDCMLHLYMLDVEKSQ